MNWQHLEKVQIAELGTCRRMASGGVGTIHTISATSELLFKRYRQPEQYRNRVEGLIGERIEASNTSKEFIDKHFAWPRASVYDRDVFLGALIPVAPEHFVAKLSTGSNLPRDLGFLLYERRARLVGIDPQSLRDKLRIVAELAVALGYLTNHGLVYEDMAPTNILWSPAPSIGSYVLDCDGIRFENEGSSPP